MSIDSATLERIRLEKRGYRSKKHLSSNGVWWFSSNDVLEINKARKLILIHENGDQKSSPYYKLTPKGLSELKKLGKVFRYHTRGEKITQKNKRVRRDKLMNAFERYSFNNLTLKRYNLEREGWMPARSFCYKGGCPNESLVKYGLVEKKFFHKVERNMSYYRLTEKGKKVLQAVKLKEEISLYEKNKLEIEKKHDLELKEDLAESKSKHRLELRLLLKADDVLDWEYLPINNKSFSKLILFRQSFRLNS